MTWIASLEIDIGSDFMYIWFRENLGVCGEMMAEYWCIDVVALIMKINLSCIN